MMPAPPLLVITDLDGTLLDFHRYRWEPAAHALSALKARDIDLVLCSSKTNAEITAIRGNLNHHGPFIVENGGALYVPEHLFPTLSGAVVRDHYQIVEFGVRYAVLRHALHEIADVLHVSVRGFGDMPVEEVQAVTGLSREEAALAKQREYDEPFVISHGHAPLDLWQREATKRGLQCTKGGRFFHLLGPTGKGEACRYLLLEYRARRGADLVAVGIGDSLNDLPLLAAVDIPILVRQNDGSYEPDIHLPRLIRAQGIGPQGWSRAVLDVLSAARCS